MPQCCSLRGKKNRLLTRRWRHVMNLAFGLRIRICPCNRSVQPTSRTSCAQPPSLMPQWPSRALRPPPLQPPPLLVGLTDAGYLSSIIYTPSPPPSLQMEAASEAYATAACLSLLYLTAVRPAVGTRPRVVQLRGRGGGNPSQRHINQEGGGGGWHTPGTYTHKRRCAADASGQKVYN